MKETDVFSGYQCLDCKSLLFPKGWSVNPQALWFECPCGCTAGRLDGRLWKSIISDETMAKIEYWLNPYLPYQGVCHACGSEIDSNTAPRDKIPSLGYVCRCGQSLRHLFTQDKYGYITGPHLTGKEVLRIHAAPEYSKYIVIAPFPPYDNLF